MSKRDATPRLPSRREALIRSAATTLALTGMTTPGVVFAQTGYALSPGQTEGPYWLDNMPERSDVRSNTSNGQVQAGLKMQLAITVAQLTGTTIAPVPNAKVDIWHASALGLYSGFNQPGGNTVGQNFLRGYQVTTAHGKVQFVSVYPGWYQGRTVHVHFRVRRYSGTTVTYNYVSQLYATDALSTQVYNNYAPYNTRPPRTIFNANDGIYSGASQGTGGSYPNNSGQYMLLRLSPNAANAIASFTVVIA